MNKRRRFPLAAAPFILWTAVFVAVPLIYILCMSFMRRADTWGVEAAFTLESYQKLLDPNYLSVFGRSLWLAVLTTLLTLLIGYPFAYFTAGLPPKKRSLALMLVIVPFWTNSLVRIPFMILSVYNAVAKLDPALIEAARDLGAGRWRAFWTITVPMTRAGIMAGCVLVFIPSIGLFFISDLLGGSKTMLLGNLIRDELLTARNWPLGAALSVVMMAATLLVIGGYRRLSGEKSLEGIV